ncbi:MAG: EAL domain-containing protein [Chloroflexota bacterium]
MESLSIIKDIYEYSAVGIILLDSALKVVWINKALENYFGLNSEKFIGKDKRILISKELKNYFEDAEVYSDKVLNSYSNNTYLENLIGHILEENEREERWLEYRSQPIRRGEHSGGRIEYYTDVSTLVQMEREIQDAHKNTNSTLNALPNLLFELDSEGRFFDYRTPDSKMATVQSEKFLGKTVNEMFSPESASIIMDAIQQTLESGHVHGVEYSMNVDEELFWFEMSMTIKGNEKSSSAHVVAISNNINEQKQAEGDLAESQRMLNDVINTIPVRVFWKDLDGIYLGCNQLFAEDAGRSSPEEVIGKDDYDMGWFDQAELYRSDDQKVMQSGQSKINYEEPQSTPDGDLIWLNTSKIPLHDSDGIVYGILGTYEDITERKNTEEKLKHMATHDNLTNLPNRELLNEILNQAIYVANLEDQLMAVLFLDLDGFKEVNDAYGHEQGDWLLQLISTRLRNILRDSDTLARIGGDEFGIVIEGFDKVEEIPPIVEKIMQALTEPFNIQESETFITGSLGISVYPMDGDDANTLLNNADRAMYQSKESGKNTYKYYSEQMETQMRERLELRNDLRLAILEQQLVLYYQPQVDLHSGQVVAVEALIRWQHPTKGLLTPDKFIMHAEDTGLIIPLGKWVMRTAIEQLARWNKFGLPAVRMSVNVSGRELQQTEYYDALPEIFAEFGISPDQIELEITENTIFRNTEKASELLRYLKEVGVKIAIDDFGSGYSTLGQLARFPFDTLKIDCLFASSLSNSADQAILGGIIKIGQDLGMRIVGEGIENMDQLMFYQEVGCSNIQGYFFSKPVLPEELESYLQDGYKIPQP